MAKAKIKNPKTKTVSAKSVAPKKAAKPATFQDDLLGRFDYMLQILKEVSDKLSITNDLLDEMNVNVDNIDDNVSVIDDNISCIEYRMGSLSATTKPAFAGTNKPDTKKSTKTVAKKVKN